MEKVVLIENFGGLGDNLQFSTLPEEFKLQKNLDFYIHQSTYNNFRNKEIFSLVWEMNPFFKGVSNEPPNAGHIHGFPGLENMICDIETMHGLECRNETFKLYYDPKKIGEFDILFDLTSTSLRNEYFQLHDKLKEAVKKILESEFKNVFFVSFKNLKSENYSPIVSVPNSMKIEVNSIFEYCDIISSCNNFVGLHSGGSHLAKAYQNKYNYNINLIEPHFINGWRFKNVNYIKLQ